MNNNEKNKLDELKKGNDQYVDNTDNIRKLKNSSLIKNDVAIILKHKHNWKTTNKPLNIDSLKDQCSFLYNNYQSIFDKLVDCNDWDIKLLFKFIKKLEDIENAVCNQDEASYDIGTLLKNIYIDPVINEEDDDTKCVNEPIEKISWSQYKASYVNSCFK